MGRLSCTLWILYLDIKLQVITSDLSKREHIVMLSLQEFLCSCFKSCLFTENSDYLCMGQLLLLYKFCSHILNYLLANGAYFYSIIPCCLIFCVFCGIYLQKIMICQCDVRKNMALFKLHLLNIHMGSHMIPLVCY